MISLACVGCCMSLQMGLLHECFATVSADELLLALVIAQVVLVNRM
jgi:hypothetical protein